MSRNAWSAPPRVVDKKGKRLRRSESQDYMYLSQKIQDESCPTIERYTAYASPKNPNLCARPPDVEFDRAGCYVTRIATREARWRLTSKEGETRGLVECGMLEGGETREDSIQEKKAMPCSVKARIFKAQTHKCIIREGVKVHLPVFAKMSKCLTSFTSHSQRYPGIQYYDQQNQCSACQLTSYKRMHFHGVKSIRAVQLKHMSQSPRKVMTSHGFNAVRIAKPHDQTGGNDDKPL